MAQTVKTPAAAPAGAGIGLKKARRAVPPTKTTLNLVVKEKKELRPSRTVPAVLAVLLAAGLFGKFAVADRFAKADAAEAAVAARRRHLAEVEQSYADYDEVQATYNRYTYTGFDRTIADRLDVMALLEREVFPIGTVRTLSIAGKSVSLTVSGLTLDQLSDLMTRLKADGLVAGVTVSTANYNGAHDAAGEPDPNAEAVANMTITLNDAGPAPETAEDAAADEAVPETLPEGGDADA